MYQIEINRSEGQYLIDCMPRPQGKLVSVRFKDDSGYVATCYQALHILQTEFETLLSAVGEFPEVFSEDFDVEKLAIDNEVEIRFQDDAKCINCGAWIHYLDMVQIDKFDYQCVDCNAKTLEEGKN